MDIDLDSTIPNYKSTNNKYTSECSDIYRILYPFAAYRRTADSLYKGSTCNEAADYPCATAGDAGSHGSKAGTNIRQDDYR
ncbi:hypothetical protein GCM10008022_24210 [Paenibacillus hunanensis]|nr:hypothetical protein GCM10008022_24210 [Paenibacillus hunanensis]